MTAPTYEWACQKCQGTNAAHTETCATCGLSANFTLKQIHPETPDDVRRKKLALRILALIACFIFNGFLGLAFLLLLGLGAAQADFHFYEVIFLRIEYFLFALLCVASALFLKKNLWKWALLTPFATLPVFIVGFIVVYFFA